MQARTEPKTAPAAPEADDERIRALAEREQAAQAEALHHAAIAEELRRELVAARDRENRARHVVQALEARLTQASQLLHAQSEAVEAAARTERTAAKEKRRALAEQKQRLQTRLDEAKRRRDAAETRLSKVAAERDNLKATLTELRNRRLAEPLDPRRPTLGGLARLLVQQRFFVGLIARAAVNTGSNLRRACVKRLRKPSP